MKISEIDSNFKIEAKLSERDISWHGAKESIFEKYGLADTDNGYLRMPRDIAQTVSDGVAALCDNTAGVRVRFATDSPYIAIKAVLGTFCRFPHMPLSGSSGFDLYKESNGLFGFVGTYVPPIDGDGDFEGILYTGNTFGKTVNYILNFPLYNPVEELYIGLKEASVVEAPDKYINRKPIVFYGSSITQGGCASHPGNCYQNFLSRALNMDYTCLGFSGSAKAEKEIAEYMAELDMLAFVSDYDHNAPDTEHLKKTHFELYRIIREKNPELPYIMISHPDKAPSDPTVRRKIIMESYIKALASGDKNVYYIDGDSLFAGNEYDTCTVEGCHPNDLGFYRMAQGMLPVLKEILFNA